MKLKYNIVESGVLCAQMDKKLFQKYCAAMKRRNGKDDGKSRYATAKSGDATRH